MQDRTPIELKLKGYSYISDNISILEIDNQCLNTLFKKGIVKLGFMKGFWYLCSEKKYWFRLSLEEDRMYISPRCNQNVFEKLKGY